MSKDKTSISLLDLTLFEKTLSHKLLRHELTANERRNVENQLADIRQQIDEWGKPGAVYRIM